MAFEGNDVVTSDEKRRFLVRLLLLAAWTAFIFLRSLQPADDSSRESSMVLQLLSSILPWDLTEHVVRKMAHFVEYAMEGMLSVLFFLSFLKTAARAFPWAWLLGILTAMTDESIQLFVEGRSGVVKDVWLDTAGVVTGMAFFLLLRLWWNRARKRRGPAGP